MIHLRIRAFALALAGLLLIARCGTPTPAFAQDTLTANYSFTKIGIGTSGDTWGQKLNANADAIDATIKSVSNVANAALPLTGGTLTGSLTAPSFVGPLTGNAATATTASTANAIASSAAVTNALGFTPANRAGDTFSGAVTFSSTATHTQQTYFNNSANLQGGNGLFLFDSSNSATPFYWYNNAGEAQLRQVGQSQPLLRAGGGTLVNGQDGLQLVRIDRGIGGNAGRIRVGTAAPGTLSQGEIYLQVSAIGGTQQATVFVGTN